ncbi:MAG TPA: hypothetical protein VIP06_02790 [Nocardioides sp.]
MTSRRKVAALVGVAVIVLGAAGAGVVLATRESTIDVKGSLVVPAGGEINKGRNGVGNSCDTDGGYSDIRRGAQVTVRDGDGKVLALGELGWGSVYAVQADKATQCRFEFTVAKVPDSKEFYSVEVSHRGEVRFDRDKLNAPLTLMLGT